MPSSLNYDGITFWLTSSVSYPRIHNIIPLDTYKILISAKEMTTTAVRTRRNLPLAIFITMASYSRSPRLSVVQEYAISCPVISAKVFRYSPMCHSQHTLRHFPTSLLAAQASQRPSDHLTMIQFPSTGYSPSTAMEHSYEQTYDWKQRPICLYNLTFQHFINSHSSSTHIFIHSYKPLQQTSLFS